MSEPLTQHDVDVELFMALTHQGIPLGLAGLHLATGKLPTAGQGGRLGPLRGQNTKAAVLPVEDGGGDHDRRR